MKPLSDFKEGYSQTFKIETKGIFFFSFFKKNFIDMKKISTIQNEIVSTLPKVQVCFMNSHTCKLSQRLSSLLNIN